MNYIYDIILNFNDINTYYEFYEWKKDDNFINLKKVPIFKVSTNTLNDLINYNIVIDKSFLNKIKNQFNISKKDNIKYSYVSIFSNGIKSIGILFDDKGNNLYKSSMLIDEESDSNRVAIKLNNTSIKYIKKNIINNSNILRDDYIKIKYLNKEIKKIYKSNNFDKIKYLYYEYYEKYIDDYDSMYRSLISSLKEYSSKHEDLYKLLKKQYKLIEN